MAKKQEKEQTQYVNEFGVALYIDRSNKSAVRERVKLLQQVEKTGKPIDGKRPLSKKDLSRVKMHIGWYRGILNKLNGKTAKKSSKKSA